MRKILYISLSILSIAVLLYFSKDIFLKIKDFAAVFFVPGISVKQLTDKYNNFPSQGKIRILLVPGHEPNNGGTEYKGLIERDLNVDLVEYLKKDLEKNNKLEIIVSRNKDKWNFEIQKYIIKNWESIKTWREDMKQEMTRLVDAGKIEIINSPGHGIAPTTSAIYLYGINKWASENNIDIVINIHFNDNPRIKGLPKYRGFSIYVPESQYSNSTSSVALANSVMTELSKIQNLSNMPQEKKGVTEDQDLIAIGRYNTLDSLSVLIEYAYIYEDFMQNDAKRETFIKKSADKTSDAINNFFENTI